MAVSLTMSAKSNKREQRLRECTSEYVDELNENIRNAFSAAQSANTSIPKRAPTGSPTTQLKPVNKLRLSRSVSVSSHRFQSSPSPTLSFSPTVNLPSTLASPFSRTCRSPQGLSSLNETTEQQLSQSQPVGSSTLQQIAEKTAASRMLKHTWSAQAKLESSKAKSQGASEEPVSKSQYSSPVQSADSHQKTTPHNGNLQSSRNVKSQKPLRRSKSSSGKTKASNDSASCRSSTLTAMASSSVENYATVRKSAKRLSSTLNNLSPAKSQANENLAYLNDEDESTSKTPPIPESIYARLPYHTTNSTSTLHTSSANSPALPPPIAFSDYDLEKRVESYGEAFKDYIDIDRASLNNNNSDAMSFYSDNYVRTGALGIKKSSGNHLRPTSLSTSIYSSGSSGISMTSIEGELMHGRPLPLTPEHETGSREELGGAKTPLRYQNDSPFVSAMKIPSGSGSAENKMTIPRSDPSHQLNQSAAEKQKSAEELLKQVPWFQPKMSREQVLENLLREDLGSFIIRESSTHNTCFALSVKVPKFNNPSGIAHYIIHRTPSHGFRIKGLEKEWTNLSSLVVHHTIMPELLPCTLKVPRPVSTRRHSTASRTSNSSRGSSGSASPLSSINFESRKNGVSQIDRLTQGLEKTLHMTTNAEPV